VALAACGLPDAHPPVARITATPAQLDLHDAFQTAIVLSGAASADALDDPGGAAPLGYAWRLLDDEARVEAGALDRASLTVRFRGERAPRILLEVTDEDGAVGAVTRALQLVVPSM
jgi:hypothetical protein